MQATIVALDAETARYTFVLTAIALVARVWLPEGSAAGLTVSEAGYECPASKHGMTRYVHSGSASRDRRLRLFAEGPAPSHMDEVKT
jgi:hypothetical protein